MRIYKNANLDKKHHNGVIAIGNFDGLHLGHQKVINEAKNLHPTEYPDCLLPPYRSKNKVLSKAVQQAIDKQAEKIDVPASVLMRKKWLHQLYEVIAYDKDLSDMPLGLQGWRYKWVTQTLIPVIEEHKVELKQGMGVR